MKIFNDSKKILIAIDKTIIYGLLSTIAFGAYNIHNKVIENESRSKANTKHINSIYLYLMDGRWKDKIIIPQNNEYHG